MNYANYVPVADYSPVLNAADQNGSIQQTAYVIGIVVVALSTLIASFAGYKKIVNSMRVSSYVDLEEEIRKQRVNFKDVMEDRDREHQIEIDTLRREHNAEIAILDRKVYKLELITERYGRGIVASLEHIREQDAELVSAGNSPGVIPIELVAIEREIIKSQEAGNDD